MNRRANDPRSGMIIVLVLWTIALLAALAMAASVSFRGFAGIVALDADRTRADALLKAGLEVSGGLLAKLGEEPLPAQQMTLHLDQGSVLIRLSDEGGKIDVNKASVPVLTTLLQAAGAENAKLIAQAIDRWRQDDGMQTPGMQTPGNAANPQPQQQQTQNAQISQTAQNPAAPAVQADASKKDDGFRSFTDLRQLVQIPGITRPLVERLVPLATVHGDEKVNLLTASYEVLAALPGLSPAQISTLLDMRSRSPRNMAGLERLSAPVKDYVRLEGRSVAAVEIAASLPDGYRAAAKAIIVVVPDDKQPYRVLAWMPLHVSEHRIATQF